MYIQKHSVFLFTGVQAIHCVQQHWVSIIEMRLRNEHWCIFKLKKQNKKEEWGHCLKAWRITLSVLTLLSFHDSLQEKKRTSNPLRTQNSMASLRQVQNTVSGLPKDFYLLVIVTGVPQSYLLCHRNLAALCKKNSTLTTLENKDKFNMHKVARDVWKQTPGTFYLPEF